MRYREIILEYNREKTISALGVAIQNRAAQDPWYKGKDPAEALAKLIDNFERADPTKNKQFVPWIARQYAKGNVKSEDIYKLNQDLELFMDPKNRTFFKRLGISLDINQHTPISLADTVDKLVSDTSDETNLKIKDTEIIHDGPDGTLMVPKTQEASCEIGSGTRWCTASRGEKNYFNHYAKDGPLYVWIERRDKKDGKKFQFHFPSLQFMDAKDVPIKKERLLYYANEHPVLKKLFDRHRADMEEDFYQYLAHLGGESDDEGDLVNNPLEDVDDPNIIMYMMDDKSLLKLAYEASTLKEISKDYYELIMTKPDLLNTLLEKRKKFPYELIKGLGRDVPELREYFLNDPTMASWYTRYILKKRWPEAEKVIATDALQSFHYATWLKDRFKAGEPALKENPYLWKQYQEKFLVPSE